MTTPNDQITNSIRETLSELLKPLGFKRHGSSFVADREDVLQNVAIQKSDMCNANYVRATTNLGVLSKPLAAKLGEKSSTTSETLCHRRMRIGHLTPDNHDKWWHIHGAEMAQASVSEIRDAVATYGLPELDRLGSTEKLKEE